MGLRVWRVVAAILLICLGMVGGCGTGKAADPKALLVLLSTAPDHAQRVRILRHNRRLVTPAFVEVLHQEAVLLKGQGKMPQALARLATAAEAAQVQGDRSREAMLLEEAGILEFREVRTLPLNKDFFEGSLAGYRALGDGPGQCRVLGYLAQVNWANNQPDAARTCLEAAAGVFRHAGDRVGEAGILTSLGDLARDRKHSSEALEDYAQALELLAGAAGTDERKALLLLKLGELRLADQSYQAAAEEYGKSREIYARLKSPWFQGQAALGQGRARVEAGDLAGAVEPLKAAGRCFAQVKDLGGASQTMWVQGRLRMAQGDLEGAKASLDSALIGYRFFGDRAGVAGVLESEGDLAVKRGNAAAAGKVYREAAAQYQAALDSQGAARCRQKADRGGR